MFPALLFLGIFSLFFAGLILIDYLVGRQATKDGIIAANKQIKREELSMIRNPADSRTYASNIEKPQPLHTPAIAPIQSSSNNNHAR